MLTSFQLKGTQNQSQQKVAGDSNYRMNGTHMTSMQTVMAAARMEEMSLGGGGGGFGR